MKKESIAARVARNEKRYREFTQRLADSLWVMDAETLEILFVSDTAPEFGGRSAEEIIGARISDIVTDESYHNMLRVLEKARKEYEQGREAVYRMEIECHNRNGSRVWLEMTAKFVKEEKEPLQIIGVSRGISTRKIAEINAERLLNMYKEALAEQKRLVAEIECFEKLLPICSGCRRIRGSDRNWWPLEEYVRKKTGAEVSHTMCPDCMKIYYPGGSLEKDDSGRR